MSEQDLRTEYCKKHNIHHLFELLATKVLVERPENPFEYLRNLLASVEENEAKKNTYDPTAIHFNNEKDGKKDLKKITVGTFGVDNAGKTTLLSAMGGEVDANCTPTVGFNPTQFQTEDYDICIFDLGGASNFRGIWVHYYHDCLGIIYVIDSAAEEGRFEESLKVFQEVVQHEYVKGKPLLVFANKKDLPGSRAPEAVLTEEFLAATLEPDTPYKVLPTCSLEEDPNIDEGVEWLLGVVGKDYERLSERVKEDTRKVKEEKDRQRAERLAALREEGN